MLLGAHPAGAPQHMRFATQQKPFPYPMDALAMQGMTAMAYPGAMMHDGGAAAAAAAARRKALTICSVCGHRNKDAHFYHCTLCGSDHRSAGSKKCPLCFDQHDHTHHVPDYVRVIWVSDNTECVGKVECCSGCYKWCRRHFGGVHKRCMSRNQPADRCAVRIRQFEKHGVRLERRTPHPSGQIASGAAAPRAIGDKAVPVAPGRSTSPAAYSAEGLPASSGAPSNSSDASVYAGVRFPGASYPMMARGYYPAMYMQGGMMPMGRYGAPGMMAMPGPMAGLMPAHIAAMQYGYRPVDVFGNGSSAGAANAAYAGRVPGSMAPGAVPAGSGMVASRPPASGEPTKATDVSTSVLTGPPSAPAVPSTSPRSKRTRESTPSAPQEQQAPVPAQFAVTTEAEEDDPASLPSLPKRAREAGTPVGQGASDAGKDTASTASTASTESDPAQDDAPSQETEAEAKPESSSQLDAKPDSEV